MLGSVDDVKSLSVALRLAVDWEVGRRLPQIHFQENSLEKDSIRPVEQRGQCFAHGHGDGTPAFYELEIHLDSRVIPISKLAYGGEAPGLDADLHSRIHGICWHL